MFRFPSLVNELFPELGIQNAADTKRHDHKTHRNTDDSDIQNIQQNALKKLNCWEFKKCGRGPGSDDVCPAAIDTRLKGVHGGRNSGRACWVVAGTYCGGKVQGTFAKKFDTCEKCEFYRSVKSDERELSIICCLVFENKMNCCSSATDTGVLPFLWKTGSEI